MKRADEPANVASENAEAWWRLRQARERLAAWQRMCRIADKRDTWQRMRLAIILTLLVFGGLAAGLYLWQLPDASVQATQTAWNPEWDSPLDAAVAASAREERSLAFTVIIFVGAGLGVLAFVVGVGFLLYVLVMAVFRTLWWVFRTAGEKTFIGRTRPPSLASASDPAEQPAYKEAMAAADSLLGAFRAGGLDAPLPPDFIRSNDTSVRRFLKSLPAVEVARHWGLKVKVFDGNETAPAGHYHPTGGIELGVKNLSTWTHELIHAADYRNVGTIFRDGEQLDQEVVAEFGGAVLLEALGFKHDADRGGAWEHIRNSCAKENAPDPVSVCCGLRNRACKAVALVLDTADRLPTAREAKPALDGRRAARRRDRVHEFSGVLAITVLWGVGMWLLSFFVRI